MAHTHSRTITVAASALLSVAAALLSGCQSSAPSRVEVPAPGSTGAMLYPGYDAYHFPITTDSAECQRWFDQGIQFVFGFNHLDGIRSFQEAAARDPDAAMPWWGIAYCWGMNINDPVMSKDKYKHATAAIREAQLRLDGASALERDLVEALALRYEWPAKREQKALELEYVDAMERVYRAHPSNPDVACFFAESMMNLQPWDLWEPSGAPKGRTSEIVAVIEDVLASHPNHPLACHLYIHAVEASPHPERALAASRALENRIPGSGHLVHMPSHIYVRTGNYAESADANMRAIEADRALFAKAPPADLYYLYYAHNLHFLAYSAMMEGRFETAIRAARDLQAEVPGDVVRKYAAVFEGLVPTDRHVMIRFGKWDQILMQPKPAEDLLVSTAVHHYSRGVAFAALGRTTEARTEMALFDAAAARIPGEWFVMQNRVSAVLPIARHMLEGEILFREGRHDEAFATLREGIRYEDALVYDEPPGWMVPVRHALGALLMDAERYAEAEAVYREDQARNARNGWSLLGLRLALAAQGKGAEAMTLDDPVAAAFARADVRPTSSCMCAP
jgi:tetratricopeptide (TPR) repeat protein